MQVKTAILMRYKTPEIKPNARTRGNSIERTHVESKLKLLKEVKKDTLILEYLKVLRWKLCTLNIQRITGLTSSQMVL